MKFWQNWKTCCFSPLRPKSCTSSSVNGLFHALLFVQTTFRVQNEHIKVQCSCMPSKKKKKEMWWLENVSHLWRNWDLTHFLQASIEYNFFLQLTYGHAEHFQSSEKLILNPLSERTQLNLSRPTRFDYTHFYLCATGCAWSSYNCFQSVPAMSHQIYVTCLPLFLNTGKHLRKYCLQPYKR